MADSNMGLGGDNPYLGQSNPYLQSIIDQTSRDMTDAYGRTTVAAQNAAALRSGSFGNSGLDEMQRADQKQLQTGIGDAASKLRFNDYTQQQQMYQWQQQQNQNQGQFDASLANNKDQFGRTLDQNQSQFNDQFGRSVFNDAYSQNMNNLTTGIGLLGTLGSYNSADAATAQNNYNQPLNYLNQFSNMANSLGGNGGVTNSTQGTSSSPVASALGGAQLGNSAMNWWNQQNATTYGSGTNYANANGSNDLANLGSSNGWWGTAG